MTSAPGLHVIDGPLLAERTSIRLGGRCIAEVRVANAASLEHLPTLLKSLGGTPVFIGEGSNIIASDDDLPVVLVNMEAKSKTPILEGGDGSVLLRVDAGLRLPALLAQAASLGLSGLEGLAGIPGSVGGAVAMNAGSFGVEIGSLVREVELFSLDDGLMTRPADDFSFSYRSCRLRDGKVNFLISAVTLALVREDKNAIRARMKACYAKKQAGQPVLAHSAGCVFKNPAPDAPAGRLIDEAGLKDKACGGMRFSGLHANFLVNDGTGRFIEALELIELAKETVLKRSGHTLDTEVRLWL